MNSYQSLIDNLTYKTNFSWSRWGDGEWAAVLGKKGQNTDKHNYFPDMGTRLRQVLESQPKYSLGLQNLAKDIYKDNPEFQRLVELNEWIPNEILHHASIKGNLNLFNSVLKTRDVLIIGNQHITGKMPYDGVTIPLVNCWNSYEKTKQLISKKLKNNLVVLYCASMMSNVLIHDFHKENITQIDCGSVFDPYCGRLTRSYHRKLKI